MKQTQPVIKYNILKLSKAQLEAYLIVLWLSTLDALHIPALHPVGPPYIPPDLQTSQNTLCDTRFHCLSFIFTFILWHQPLGSINDPEPRYLSYLG